MPRRLSFTYVLSTRTEANNESHEARWIIDNVKIRMTRSISLTITCQHSNVYFYHLKAAYLFPNVSRLKKIHLLSLLVNVVNSECTFPYNPFVILLTILFYVAIIVHIA